MNAEDVLNRKERKERKEAAHTSLFAIFAFFAVTQDSDFGIRVSSGFRLSVFGFGPKAF